MGYSKKDLQKDVESLNSKFKMSDKTPIAFKVGQAYNGTKVVLRQNGCYGSGEFDVTYGYQSSKETAFDLLKKQKDLKEIVSNAKRRTKEDYLYNKSKKKK